MTRAKGGAPRPGTAGKKTTTAPPARRTPTGPARSARPAYALLDEWHHARLMPVADMARELGVSRSTVYRWMREERVPLRSAVRVPDGRWQPRPARRRTRRK